MQSQCTFNCPTCGYKLAGFTSRCPRCATFLLDKFKCSGNCSKCVKQHQKPSPTKKTGSK